MPSGTRIYPSVDGFYKHFREEIDFIVCIPNEGVALIEVKNGLKLRDGHWYQFRSEAGRQVEVDLASQLTNERLFFEELISPYFPNSNKTPRYVQFLVLTDLSLEVNQVLPRGIQRQKVIAKNQLEYLGKIIKDHIHTNNGGRSFTFEDLSNMDAAIDARGNTYREYVKSTVVRGQTVEELTSEQGFILDMIAKNLRVYVEGGPGTGKTVLAIELAYRLQSEGKRVGLVCYNNGLARDIRNRSSQWNHNLEFLGVVKEDLAKYLKIKLPKVPPSQKKRNDYWDKRIPRLIRTATRFKRKYRKFDAWVVDEAQDLSTIELENLQRLLKNRKTGKIYLFGDPKQDLFQKESKVPWSSTHLQLLFNVRNSPSIAELLNQCFPNSTLRFVGDPQRRKPAFILVTETDGMEPAIKHAVASLQANGWADSHIGVVATGPRLKIHDLRRQERSDDEYWQDYFAGDSIFYSRLLNFKGLEKPVVILVFNEIYSSMEEVLRHLFVGGGRARDELILILSEKDYGRIPALHDYMIPFNSYS